MAAIFGKRSRLEPDHDRGVAQTLASHDALTESAGVTGKPFWLECGPESIYGVLHAATPTSRNRVAALILPTFGWDSDTSYRARRAWAVQLAESGVTAVRFDFPGTEDSVGPTLGPGRVQAWIDATASMAQWLRDQVDCERVVAVGIGLGGLIAHQAIVAGAAIDDLVLWGARATGRSYVRELRAFAAAMAEQADRARDAERDDGVIGIGGHMMSAETVDALGAIKVPDSPLPDAPLRRVLLVGRDALGVDKNLRSYYEESGANVTVIDAADYHLLVARPELHLVPTGTIAASLAWMLDPASEGLDPIQHPLAGPVPDTSSSLTFEYNSAEIRETILEFETSAGRLTGIVSEPVVETSAPYCLVISNSGALRRTGPSRMFVEIARAAAASGIPAARFDLPGLGDSDGVVARGYERTSDDDAASIVAFSEIYDHLQRLGIADRFATCGLCVGGYLALMMVPNDRRSIGAIALNPPTLKWGEVERRALRRGLLAIAGADAAIAPRNRDALPRPLRRTLDRVEQFRYIVETRGRKRLAYIDLLWRNLHRPEVGTTVEVLDQLGQTGARFFVQLSDNEPLMRMFAQPKVRAHLQRWPNIQVSRLPTNDHDLRPLWIQEIVFAGVSQAIDELRTVAEAQEVPPVSPSGPSASQHEI